MDFYPTLSNSYFRIPKDRPQKCSSSICQEGDASLVLTLGHSSNSCINEECSINLEGTVRQKSVFGYISKPELNLELSLSTTSYAEADTSLFSQELSSFQKTLSSPFVNEGCSSSKWKKIRPLVPPLPVEHIVKHTISTTPSDHVYTYIDTYGVTHENLRKKTAVRLCRFERCPTRARGATGFCIRHGGGKRCRMEGCKRSAEGKTVFCIAHGGGPRCQFPECKKGAQGKTMLCKAHGGGKRCTFSGCERSAAEGRTQLCKGHGGGKRCTHDEGCTKSVHGGTLFCVRHGGGKRCATTGCTKSARGSTSHCVRHGGGKRCTHAECGNSAQGGTNFCKTHGGGKRCSWGHLGSKFGDHTSVPCDKFARGRFGLCSAHNVQYLQELERRVHGGNYFQNSNFGNNYDQV